MTVYPYHPLANLFPLLEGKDFEEFCAGKQDSAGRQEQEALARPVPARTLDADRRMSGFEEVRPDKAVWIADGRSKFRPGSRQPCAVCGKYIGLTEAHHIVPLGVQFDAGAVEPIQALDWLCPTHHAAEHFHLRHLLANTMGSIAGMPLDEADIFFRRNSGFVDFFTALPNWQRVRR